MFCKIFERLQQHKVIKKMPCQAVIAICVILQWLHYALASCGAVYCNRSCLRFVTASERACGRVGGRCPNLTTASARAVFASIWALLKFFFFKFVLWRRCYSRWFCCVCSDKLTFFLRDDISRLFGLDLSLCIAIKTGWNCCQPVVLSIRSFLLVCMLIISGPELKFSQTGSVCWCNIFKVGAANDSHCI